MRIGGIPALWALWEALEDHDSDNAVVSSEVVACTGGDGHTALAGLRIMYGY